jgi:tagatose-1,6-bisphosphate aldolase non-catalytic subunit AgaZ/GatZ
VVEIRNVIRRLTELQPADPITLLAVCPNSAAVLEAAVAAAARFHAPMLFAATLNQVDLDGGYTGWTPQMFVVDLRRQADRLGWRGPLYACLDHGGPWLKDAHSLKHLDLEATLDAVRQSLSACLRAGYRLLHIDATVRRDLPAGATVPIAWVLHQTIELIAFVEAERLSLGLPTVDYEVGTEEVHGGLADLSAFAEFLRGLRSGLEARSLLHAWPCFIVGKVGTDLHTTTFDAAVARRLHDLVSPFGSLIKGHYTDWVAQPGAYPESGMGGANLGPELTAAELEALDALVAQEEEISRRHPASEASGFRPALERAVLDSGRWKKWLLPDERGRDFEDLSAERRDWLIATGARYVWAQPSVAAARRRLYDNLASLRPTPHAQVLGRILDVIETYVVAFHLEGSLERLGFPPA